MRESAKTGVFAAAAIGIAIAAAMVEPERATPDILNDQGGAFYPKFTDPQAPKTIEVVDYDEATATARPLKVQLQKGRWIVASHHNYRVDAGDRLVKTAAALIDLRKEQVRSDSAQDHAQFGVVDPLDQRVAGLAGRGKRVTLRDAHGEALADYILGKAVEGKPGQRYVRVPGGKRTYVVKTDADPSARFADWVNADLLRIASGSLRKVTINSYSIDEQLGRLMNVETVVLTQDGGKWRMQGVDRFHAAAAASMASTLDGLKIVDVRPKPPGLASDLRKGTLQVSLETAMSLRPRGFFLAPNGRLLANEGEMIAETRDGLLYTLRFGEIATEEGETARGDSRHLFVTAHFDKARAASYGGDAVAGERLARDLNDRFADWYYIIGGADFQRLRLRLKDLKP
ncbi:MAG: DUF4340 domain-containing protein [Bryobacteraceae bacterium]